MNHPSANFVGLIGQDICLPGHFEQPVRLEAIRPLGAGFELRVRCADGHLEETVLSDSEFRSLAEMLCEAAYDPRRLEEYLYVVWDPHLPGAVPLMVQDPGHALERVARAVRTVSHIELSAEAIEQAAHAAEV